MKYKIGDRVEAQKFGISEKFYPATVMGFGSGDLERRVYVKFEDGAFADWEPGLSCIRPLPRPKKLIPWTAETCPQGVWQVRDKRDTSPCHAYVSSLDGHTVTIGGTLRATFEGLHKSFEHRILLALPEQWSEWKPCGREVEDEA